MADQPIVVHYQQMEEWLKDRRTVFEKKHKGELKTLLECAPQLVQLVQDIANQEKLMKKATSSAADCEKMIGDAERVAEALEKKRQQFLVDHGLFENDAVAFDPSLLGPLVDAHIARSIARVTAVLVQFTERFMFEFKQKYDDILSESMKRNDAAHSHFERHFPWLSRLLAEHGLPLRDEAEDVRGEEEGAALAEIDWGDTADCAPAGAASEIVIDWEAGSGGAAHVNGDEGKEEEEDGEGEDALVPANHTTLSVNVSHGKTRSCLLCELEAARCFASERLRCENVTFFADFVASVDSVLDITRSSKDAEFVRMKETYRLRDSFEEQVNRFARTIAATHARKKAHESKLSSLHLECSQLEPRQNELVRRARGVRDTCLAELKKMFPDRTVSIVGDINKHI